MIIPFTKMHGLGNDFILIDCRELRIPNPSDAARSLCDRRFGIGADQLLLLLPSRTADFTMGIFNADGSEVEMCGNGIRCFAKYVWDRGISGKDVIEVETQAGIIRPERANGLVKVNMGRPVFDPEKIPVAVSGRPSPITDFPLEVEDRTFSVSYVSMGNPHAVIVVEEVLSFPVGHYGPKIEHHRLFPKRINVEFVEVLNRSEIRMRVWERGSGETLACGTGASASAVVCAVKGLTDRSVTVHLAAGDLLIEWSSEGDVYMTGPAVEVFTGSVNYTSI